ncbi:ABC transporter ATP-binding protein [bacterium M00.F.Ca.ET.228.01.1.1]|uniref:ABC transporter ATP-binding protein n=1 Tax=Paraburkholderia phenoliruptrix TaxID=252970 RepID=UPI00109212F4|nr:ABC transporter ATP-binding protein [Paraburkholderia phenoliruptrix]TGP39596.1 ABC transporter ATP-binding protein [bacterium M00.F.Ca.ET.228.01.1.1]TGR95332.1 ABC transporter ATP-binding protein [bacterium M00.F.Ca.ET.191.01.1.1]TGT96195.1 ABC transporter ATP-binding protein [bacterium M00.F.Ca.ET.155.01.1.1]MBW0449544.1 ABC transporter ATP-binding protein [Paraburkholderia phenoliruptrix]MBW9101982.1 ABC transporter ATP-binding protein [Paraburkholderia phenoliruptrix]
MSVLLDVSGVESGYGGGRVLNGVSVRVARGEVLALIGRNGVGKTTLMRTLIGLVKLDNGEIRLDGQAIGHEKPYVRAQKGMGYVPQGREIFGALTVAENLQVGAQANRAQAARMREQVVGYFPVLKQRYAQKAGTMSGGEQQQLAIARALISAPKVLLLDEPSEGIQPSIVDLIGETLQQIARETGIGVVLVEQDMGMVERIATRCCVMDKGRIVDTLSPAQLGDEQLIRQYLAL